MPEKDWVQWLPGGFLLYCVRRNVGGICVGFVVVLIHDNICITRYDTAHGFAHRDVLGAVGGQIKKISCPAGMTYNQAFWYAIRDLKKNYEAYYRYYAEN